MLAYVNKSVKAYMWYRNMYMNVHTCGNLHRCTLLAPLDIPLHMLYIVISMHMCVHASTFVCAPVCHVCQCAPAAWKSPHLLVHRSPDSLLTPSPLVLVLSTVLVFIFAAVFNPYKNVYEVR